MSLKDIIADLEKAEGPSRELDEAIMGYLGLIPTLGGYYGWERSSPGYFSRPTNGECSQFENAAAALYTSSVDAALTLVPEKSWVDLSGPRQYLHIPTPSPNFWKAVVDTWRDVAQFGWGATPALALCIAALRARCADVR